METISSRKNERARFLRELLREKKLRDERGMFAAEGDHLCVELSRAGLRIGIAAFTEKAAAKYPATVEELCGRAETTFVISEELAEYISDTKSPQGLFAAADIPGWGIRPALPANAKRVLVLDGVQDPGNVGTMIRTAEALGADCAALLENCADAWSPKTLRASMGSAFRLPIVDTAADGLPVLLQGFTMYAAMLNEKAKRLGETEFPEKTAIVIGSEGAGVSKGVAEMCGEKIYIPIRGAESLNAAAAAAILLWELLK